MMISRTAADTPNADSARQTDVGIALVGACRSPSHSLGGWQRMMSAVVTGGNAGTRISA
jgi:hypothetical protein